MAKRTISAVDRERGRALKGLREAANLTGDEAGRLPGVGVGKAAVSSWETGQTVPEWFRWQALDEGYNAGGKVLALFGDVREAAEVAAVKKRVTLLEVEMVVVRQALARQTTLIERLRKRGPDHRSARPGE